MPRYSMRDLAVNDVLTNISVMHTQDAEGFVSHKVFPVVPIEEQVFRWKVFDRADLLRTDARPRTPGSSAVEKTFGITESNGFAIEWAIGFILPDEDRKTKGSIVDDTRVTRILTQDLLIRRDVDWATTYLANGVWGNTDQVGAGTAAANAPLFWDNGSATIIANVLAWSDMIKLASGRRPNAAVMTPDVWRVLMDDPDIVDRIKYTAPPGTVVSKELVAALFGLDELHVIDSIRATSAEGAATLTTAFMDTEKFLLYYASDSPSLDEPSAGYTFSWAAFDQVKEPMEGGGAAMLKWRDENIHSDRFEGQMFFQHGLVVATSAILARNLLT